MLLRRCCSCNRAYFYSSIPRFYRFINTNTNNGSTQSEIITKQTNRQTIRHEMGEIRGELTYYRTLITSDKSKHETQSTLVRPLNKLNSPILPQLNIELLNNHVINIPNDLIQQQSVYYNRITVLLLISNAYSAELLQRWRDEYINYMTNNASIHEQSTVRNNVQFISVYMIDRWILRKLFSRFFIRNLRSRIIDKFYSYTGITSIESPIKFTQSIGRLRELFYGTEYSVAETTGYMNMRGRMFGNLLVVDNCGKIRWMTIGKPKDNEQQSYFNQLIIQLTQSMQLTKAVNNNNTKMNNNKNTVYSK